MAHSAQLSLLDKVNPHFKSGRRLVKQRVTLLLRICSRQFRHLLLRLCESVPPCTRRRRTPPDTNQFSPMLWPGA